jgi:hypothetical protein
MKEKDPKKRARVKIDQGPAKFLLLRQPGYPENWVPVAFRPAIAPSLALSGNSMLNKQFQYQDRKRY